MKYSPGKKYAKQLQLTPLNSELACLKMVKTYWVKFVALVSQKGANTSVIDINNNQHENHLDLFILSCF